MRSIILTGALFCALFNFLSSAEASDHLKEVDHPNQEIKRLTILELEHGDKVMDSFVEFISVLMEGVGHCNGLADASADQALYFKNLLKLSNTDQEKFLEAVKELGPGFKLVQGNQGLSTSILAYVGLSNNDLSEDEKKRQIKYMQDRIEYWASASNEDAINTRELATGLYKEVFKVMIGAIALPEEDIHEFVIYKASHLFNAFYLKRVFTIYELNKSFSNVGVKAPTYTQVRNYCINQGRTLEATQFTKILDRIEVSERFLLDLWPFVSLSYLPNVTLSRLRSDHNFLREVLSCQGVIFDPTILVESIVKNPKPFCHTRTVSISDKDRKSNRKKPANKQKAETKEVSTGVEVETLKVMDREKRIELDKTLETMINLLTAEGFKFKQRKQKKVENEAKAVRNSLAVENSKEVLRQLKILSQNQTKLSKNDSLEVERKKDFSDHSDSFNLSPKIAGDVPATSKIKMLPLKENSIKKDKVHLGDEPVDKENGGKRKEEREAVPFWEKYWKKDNKDSVLDDKPEVEDKRLANIKSKMTKDVRDFYQRLYHLPPYDQGKTKIKWKDWLMFYKRIRYLEDGTMNVEPKKGTGSARTFYSCNGRSFVIHKPHPGTEILEGTLGRLRLLIVEKFGWTQDLFEEVNEGVHDNF